MGYIVQSIVFDKNKGWNIKTARKWIKDHKEFSEPIKVDETTNTFRFRLIPPKKAEQMGFTDYRMKTLASGDVGIMLDIAYNKLKGGANEENIEYEEEDRVEELKRFNLRIERIIERQRRNYLALKEARREIPIETQDNIDMGIELRMLEDQINGNNEEIRRNNAEIQRLEEERQRIERALHRTGGSLANEDLQALLAKSYSKNPEDYKDFKVDKSLSGQRVQVYHNPTTQQTIVAHRGTSSIPNWIENVAYAVSNNKSGKAFQHSKKIQDQAYQKYGKENITTIGHSKGALHAQEYGKEGKEVITLNKPVNITDALFTRVPKSQTDIRTQYDPVSFLRPFQRGSKVETIKSTTKNPLAEHKTSVLGRLDPRRLFGSSMMCPCCGVDCCCGMMRGGMVEEEEDVGIIDNITEEYNGKIQQLRYRLRSIMNRGYMSRGTIEGNEIERQIRLLEEERDKLIEDISSQNIMERLRDREIKKGRGMMSGGVSIQFNNGLVEFDTSSPSSFYRSIRAYYFSQRPQRRQEFQQALQDAPNFVRQQEISIVRDFQNNWNEFLDVLNGDNMMEKRRIVGATQIDISGIIDAVIDGSVNTESEGALSSSDDDDEEEQGAGMCGGAGLTPLSMGQFQELVNATTSQNQFNNWTKFQKFIQKYGGNTDVIRQRLVLFLNLPPYVGAETERAILSEFDLYVNYGQEENEGAGRKKRKAKAKAKKGKN